MRLLPKSRAEYGEADEMGFIAENVSLRDAIDYVGGTRTNHVGGVMCIEADSSPMLEPRWVTVVNDTEYETGAYESRSIHFPEHLTPATRRRIARLVGA